jgi:hypothetical protein
MEVLESKLNEIIDKRAKESNEVIKLSLIAEFVLINLYYYDQ